MSSFDGHRIGWDFEEHQAHIDPRTKRPYLGGTDLEHDVGEPVKAYVSGRVSAVTRTSVTISPPSGNRTLILHLGNVLVTVGDQVHPDTVVGTASLLWPHYNDLLPAGVHVRAAFLTPPVEPIRRNTMTTLYVKLSTGAGGEGSLWALAGDAGSPCVGNWIEFVRHPADQSDADRGWRMVQAHGKGIFLSDAEWVTYKAAYTTAPPVGTVKPDPAVIVALETLTAAVKALPEQSAVALVAEQKKPGN